MNTNRFSVIFFSMELTNEPTQSLSSKAQGIEPIRNGVSDFTKETAGPFNNPFRPKEKNDVSRYVK